MYIYNMKFSILKPGVKLKDEKDTLDGVFEKFRIEYNKIYGYKNHSSRLLRPIVIDTDVERILMCLESNEKLSYPSKSISQFTRLLVGSKEIGYLIHNKRLFVCNDVVEKLDEHYFSDKKAISGKIEISDKKIIISDSQVIGALVRWVVEASSDSLLMQKRKREVINLIKESMSEILFEENIVEDWGL